jgi:hemoglobin
LSPPAIAHRDDGLRRRQPPGETRTCTETPDAWSHCYADETSEVRLHGGNGPHQEMDRRAIASFDQALVDVGLASDDRLRQVLHDYFAWTTLTTISRYHRSADAVPDGLHIPRWWRDGLVEG